jgi:DUF4097 and DUF4098 domain-containing protein YvlB
MARGTRARELVGELKCSAAEDHLTLKAHNGGIRIADVSGQLEFETTNGGVSLQRLAGNVHGHTTNGGLSVELAGSRGRQPAGYQHH